MINRVNSFALEKLHEAAQALTATLELPQVLETTVQKALEVLGADLAILYQYWQAKKQFELPPIVAGKLLEPGLPSHIELGEEDIVATLVQRGIPHYAPDAALDPVIFAETARGRREVFVAREKIRSSAAVPLQLRDETVGVMFVNYRSEQCFDENQRRLIETFANYAAIAIQNARAFERRVIQLEASTEIDRAITSLDPTAVLGKILSAALQIIGVHDGNIVLVDESGEYLESPIVLQSAEWKPGSPEKFKIGEMGVTGWVAKHKKTARIPDVHAEKWKGIYVEVLPHTRSELVVPLLDDRGELLGVINLESPRLNAFSDEDQRLLEALSKQAVIAIDNAMRYEAEQRARHELEVLNEMDKAISSTLELDQVLQLILDQGLQLVKAPTGNIMLFDKVKSDLWMAVERGVAEEHKGARQSLEQGVVGRAARERRTLMVGDVTEDPWDKIYLQFIPNIRSELAVPMLQDDRLIGVINAESPEMGAFGEADERLFEALAAQAVIAIKNAEQYRRLRALRAIDQAIISALDLDEVMERILRSGLDIIGAEWGDITLYGEDEKELVNYVVVGPGPVIEKIDIRTAQEDKLLEKGIVSWVAENRKLYLSKGNVQDDPLYRGYPEIRSEVAVPLLLEDRLLGVLNLESRREDAFDEEDLQMLQALAAQAVISVQNARYYEASEKARGRFEVLTEVGREIINAPLDVDAILAIALETGLAGTGAHSASARLWDEEKQELRAQVRRGVTHEWAWEPIKLGEGVNGWVAEHKKTYLVRDVENPPEGVEYRRGHPGTRSELVVPLLVGDKYFGNLDLGHPEKDGFEEEEIRLIEGLADQVAVAIHRVRQREELEAAARRELEAQWMASVGQSALELTHRIGNSLGGITGNVQYIRDVIGRDNEGWFNYGLK